MKPTPHFGPTFGHRKTKRVTTETYSPPFSNLRRPCDGPSANPVSWSPAISISAPFHQRSNGITAASHRQPAYSSNQHPPQTPRIGPSCSSSPASLRSGTARAIHLHQTGIPVPDRPLASHPGGSVDITPKADLRGPFITNSLRSKPIWSFPYNHPSSHQLPAPNINHQQQPKATTQHQSHTHQPKTPPNKNHNPHPK